MHVLFAALVSGLILFVWGRPCGAMDRYMDVHKKLPKGPTMTMGAASFFGSDGYEEFIGVTALPGGRVLAVGNSWGPPFVEDPVSTVLGTDRLWDIPLFPESFRSHSAAGKPSMDHPNRTGFMAEFSPNLDRVERITRLGWGSASIANVLRMRDGSLVISGRAWRSLRDFPCATGGMREFKSDKLVTDPGSRNDSYVAKLRPDGRSFEWIWTLAGCSAPPRGVHEGADGEVILRMRFIVLRVLADGSAIGDFEGTELGKMPAWRFKGANEKDGTLLVGGGWMTSTGREPWRRPWLYTYDGRGRHLAGYYGWTGPMVGHDDYRLVSDSSVKFVESTPDGRIVMAGRSDGGNSVFSRHPTDLDVSAGEGLVFNLWGAGVATFYAITAFDPTNVHDVARTVWCTYLSGKPSGIEVDNLGAMNDGSIVVMGRTLGFLVQTTQKYCRSVWHYLDRGRHEPGEWPTWLGLGGEGHYVAVLSPDLDKLRWASVMPCLEHTDSVAVPNGLVVVARCDGDNAGDGRPPALYDYDHALLLGDVRDWPGMVRLLVKSAEKPRSPAGRVWSRMDEDVRRSMREWFRTSGTSKRMPKDLRSKVAGQFDKLIFDDTGLYDPSVWPDPKFDSGQKATAAKLPGGKVTQDELGLVNRRLIEQALPEHIFAIPGSNRLYAKNGVQMNYGGGPGDGFIYLLRPPPGGWPPRVMKSKPAEPPPEPAAPAEVAAADTEGAGEAGGIDVDAKDITATLSPTENRKYCTYAVCRNTKKRRPLFLLGTEKTGDLKLQFERDALVSMRPTLESAGGLCLKFAPEAVLAADVVDFAAPGWLSETSKPPVTVRLHSPRNWKETGADSVQLLSRKQQYSKLQPPSATYRLVGNVDVSAGGDSWKIKDVAMRAKVTGALTRWIVRLDFMLDIPGAKSTDGTPVTLKVSHTAYSAPPKIVEAPKIPDADDMDTNDMDMP